MAITTTLTAAPDLPDRTEQDQTVFDTRMAAYWAYIKNDFESELNAIASEINSTVATDIGGAVTDAEAAQTAAELAETNAETAESNAELAQGAAETARDAAANYAGATIYTAGTTYAAGDVVLDPGDSYKPYISQQAANTGNTPNTDDGTWWVAGLSETTVGEEFVASGALSTGDVVVLNSDGTVSVVDYTPASGGTAAVFESAAVVDVSATFDSNLNKVVIAYVDQGNLDYGTAVVGTVSGTDITFGTPVVFESAAINYPAATFDSLNNKVVIAYRDSGNSGFGTAIVGTVSGTSISFGTAVVFESATVVDVSATFDSNLNKVVIAYHDSDNSGFGTAIVGTVSGTSISFGTAVVFESATTTDISTTFDSLNNKVVIAYQDVGNSDYGTAIVGTVSGTAISFGTAVVFESAASEYTSSTFDSNSNKVVIAYRDVGNSSYGTAIVGTVSGTSISFDTAVVFESAITSSISSTFDSNSNKVVIAYQDAGNSSYGTAIVGTVSGTSISFDTAVVFESAITSSISSTFDSNSNKVVIAYKDFDNSSYGTSCVFSQLSTDADQWIGISSDDYIDAQTASIYAIGDKAAGQTGLTIDTAYYVDEDGLLTTSATDYGKIGRAVSATELLITEGNI